jgi:hypothetical protein
VGALNSSLSQPPESFSHGLNGAHGGTFSPYRVASVGSAPPPSPFKELREARPLVSSAVSGKSADAISGAEVAVVHYLSSVLLASTAAAAAAAFLRLTYRTLSPHAPCPRCH